MASSQAMMDRAFRHRVNQGQAVRCSLIPSDGVDAHGQPDYGGPWHEFDAFQEDRIQAIVSRSGDQVQSRGFVYWIGDPIVNDDDLLLVRNPDGFARTEQILAIERIPVLKQQKVYY